MSITFSPKECFYKQNDYSKYLEKNKFTDMEKWVFNSFIIRIENIYKEVKKPGWDMDNDFYPRFTQELNELLKNFPVFQFIMRRQENNEFWNEIYNTKSQNKKYQVYMKWLKGVMDEEAEKLFLSKEQIEKKISHLEYYIEKTFKYINDIDYIERQEEYYNLLSILVKEREQLKKIEV